MKVLAVIPARGGSKGVPRKNTKILGGKPLIAHVAEAAQRASSIDTVIISTEDEEILSLASSLDIAPPFQRPEELATDQAQLAQVIYHAFSYYEEIDQGFDAVLSLQPTAPFVTAESLDRAVAIMKSTGCDSVSAIARFTQGHPLIAKELTEEEEILPFCTLCSVNAAKIKRRQDRKAAYYITGGFYLRNRNLLEKGDPKGHWLGIDSRGVALSELESVDIDSELDFEIAEFLCRRFKH